MASPRRGLGATARNAAFRSRVESVTHPAQVEELRDVPPHSLVLSVELPSGATGGNSMEGFLDSVSTFGILEPILAREQDDGRLAVIAGHRRLEAAKAAKLSRVPVRVLTADDDTAQAMAAAENLVRGSMGPLEEARRIADFKRYLVAHGRPATQDVLAKLLGRSTGRISESLRIAERITDEVIASAGVDPQSLRIIPKTALLRVVKERDPDVRADKLRTELEAPGPDSAMQRVVPRPVAAFHTDGSVDGKGPLTLRLLKPLDELLAVEAQELVDFLDPWMSRLREQAAGNAASHSIKCG